MPVPELLAGPTLRTLGLETQISAHRFLRPHHARPPSDRTGLQLALVHYGEPFPRDRLKERERAPSEGRGARPGTREAVSSDMGLWVTIVLHGCAQRSESIP